MIDTESLLKKHKKTLLTNIPDKEDGSVYDRTEIIKLIPHREPFLLIDRIIKVDLENELIIGSRFISGQDPIFKGHFPGYPVYPGTLQIEMIGQLGLCLTYFLQNKTITINNDARPVNVRATKILGAGFYEPLLPDKEAFLVVKKLAQDPYFGTIIGQTISDNKICSTALCEVIFLE